MKLRRRDLLAGVLGLTLPRPEPTDCLRPELLRDAMRLMHDQNAGFSGNVLRFGHNVIVEPGASVTMTWRTEQSFTSSSGRRFEGFWQIVHHDGRVERG